METRHSLVCAAVETRHFAASLQVERRTCLRIALAGLALSAFLALGWVIASPDPAVGQVVADPAYWKQNAERRNTVHRLVYSQSPQTIPATYDPVREAEEVLRQNQRSLPSSNPRVPSLWQQIRGVTVKSALASPLRVIGPVGLAAGTFEVGWKIGSGINAKFLKFGVPEPAALGSITWDRLQPVEAGALTWPGFPAADRELFQIEGRHWFYSGTKVSLTRAGSFPEADPDCAGNEYSAPPQWASRTVPETAAPYNICYGSALGRRAIGIYDVPHSSPLEEYTGQPYTHSSPAPTPPVQSTVEQTVTTELEKPEGAVLRQWLNYRLGSPGETDPLGIGDQNSDIEFPERNKKWKDHGHRFNPPYIDPHEYGQDAADIVERGRDPSTNVERCVRLHDNAEIFWDPEREAMVIVDDQGNIKNFYPPSGGYDYYESVCRGEVNTED